MERHREALRAACDADQEIWAIYPYSMIGEAFDQWWSSTRIAPGRAFQAILHKTPFVLSLSKDEIAPPSGPRPSTSSGRTDVNDGWTVVGTSSFSVTDGPSAVVEIGGTYLHPAVRGTGLNGRIKRLMIGAAFTSGARRLEFKVDGINTRSRAAVEKLGAKLDGILRSNRVTWTGRVRDTCVYSVLADEWPAVEARLTRAA